MEEVEVLGLKTCVRPERPANQSKQCILSIK
jgi:hypothetical protein